MFRGRDFVAALFALILTRMAWTENYASESLSATFRLAFYVSRKSSSDEVTAPPVPLDVDGDGIVEAVAIATQLNGTESSSSSSAWIIEVADLKPLHTTHSGPQTAPFRPKVIFSSQPISFERDEEVVPLKMTSGHIIVNPRRHHHHHHAKVKDPEQDRDKSDDRTRHYYCGRDWHDATNNCHQHCPGGASSECPEGMMCYADTMCDALRYDATHENEELKLELTPGGGLPSIATFWSDGTVTLHSITADILTEEEQHEKHRPKRHHPPSRLQLRLMWTSAVLLDYVTDSWILDDVGLLMLGAEDVALASEKHNMGKYGVVVVGGSFSTPNKFAVPFIQALDSMKGGFLWEQGAASNSSGYETTAQAPQERGTASSARRRSRIPSLTSEKQPADLGTPNCLAGYRQSLLDPSTQALPYAYFGIDDARLIATHLNRHTRRHHNHKMKESSDKKMKWSSALISPRKAPKKDTLYGRPNAIINHHQGGLRVMSLKNGRTVCHVSLLDNVLYADLNHDGILDNVQVVTEDNAALVDHMTGEYTDKWVTDLSRRVSLANEEEKEKGFKHRLSTNARLCHVLALSGMPAREELFSAPVCGSNSPSQRQGDHPSLEGFLHAAPPLVVERLDGLSDSGSDIVIAMNHGTISRFQPPTGKRQWQVTNHESLPTWGADDAASPYLGRVDFAKAGNTPWIRPILVTGDDGMALLSSGQGHILAMTTFPQTPIGRPVLADLSGDGTTDVIMVSADAVWGYQVVVRTGAQIVFRVMVGLLLVGVGIAVLRNRFGQRQGVDKRSTDA